MSILKVRGLADVGVLADPDPYDLPLGGWSFAANARFVNGKISRAPVWRTAGTVGTTPRYVFARYGSQGADDIYIGYLNGRVKSWANGVETDVSLAGWVNSSAEAQWSHCSLANVQYVNRSDRVPWGLTPGSSAFTTITGWNSAWSCRLLRAYNGALVALNVTKSGVNSPTMVKASDIVTDPGVNPLTWDEADPTANAYENSITEMEGRIVDACVLGNDLVIYGSTQNFVMRADGSDNVYSITRMPFDGGAINANCSVEFEGKQFVFGPNDIYMHDGLTKVSVIEGKNKELIFGTLNASKSSRFFVTSNPNLRTISFHYVGTDTYAGFTGAGNGCNRSAVLHVPSGTWSFDDCPFVLGAVMSSVSVTSATWASSTASWSTAGGSWQDLEDGGKRAHVYIGEANATYSLSDTLYVNDPYGRGSVVNLPVNTAATRGMLLERSGIDLDEVNVELRGYKHIVSVYPQGRIDSDSAPLEFSFGVTMYAGLDPVYSAYKTYDPRIDHKVDFDQGGRFLAVRIRYADYKTVSISGLDLDVEVLSDAP